jgi:hypothetical protein
MELGRLSPQPTADGRKLDAPPPRARWTADAIMDVSADISEDVIAYVNGFTNENTE